MPAQDSRLPDITIWDSIRKNANAALKDLVRKIEGEISKDQTLAELRTTGSARMALEARATSWMIRAYACCLDCWQLEQRQEETLEVRSAIYFYGLSPFFSEQMLRLLRLAAGVSELTISRFETERNFYYGASDSNALQNASAVWSKLNGTWFLQLPPIAKKSVASHTQVITKAPPPPHALSGTGHVAAGPKPVELPMSFPPDFPASLALKARLILSDTVKQYPDRSKLEALCKELVPKYGDLLCVAVSTGLVKAHEAPDQLSTILHYLLVANCDLETQRFEIKRSIINSDQWHAMLKRLVECEESLREEPADTGKKKNSTRQRIDNFIEDLQKTGHSITRRDIWRVAGYDDATEFERFQREDSRTTSGGKAKFDRILGLSAEEFLQRLAKTRI